MSVTFTSKDTGKTLLIGGQETVDAGSSGSIGPFPKYSISREDLRTTDGTYINTKYSINVTGTAVLKSDDSQNMLAAGQRQFRVQGEALIKMQFNRMQWPMHGVGLLEIEPYGGLANRIKFNDARLTSMELPEQTDESAGVQNLEYSFSFEAFQDSSDASDNTGADSADGDHIVQPTYLLSSAEESWDLSPNEGTVAFQDNDISGNPYLSFTLTHTLSATGLKKFKTGTGLDTDGEAWRQAVQWVGSRLIDNPETDITTDVMGNTAVTKFNPFYMDQKWEMITPDWGTDDNLGYSLTTDYKVYNHVRTVNNDQAAGSYSVTDTWLVSEQTQNVTHDVEISIETGPEVPANVVSISGTIQGLSLRSPDDTKWDTLYLFDSTEVRGEIQAETDTNITIQLIGEAGTTIYSKTVAGDKLVVRVGYKGEDDKYTNALAALDSVLAKASTAATTAYTDSGLTGTLRTGIENNKTVGHNRGTGTITWSISYDDMSVEIEGALKESITITDDNEDGSNEVIAIIGVIGNAAGPVIQDMGTTTERTRSISVDITMQKANRTAKPNAAPTFILAYQPADSYQQSKTETWDPLNGVYNLSVSWTYN